MGGSLLLAAVTGVCRTIPLATGYRLADLASALHRRSSPQRRRAVESNLSCLLGDPPSSDLVSAVFRAYGRFLFEWLRGPEGLPCAFEGWDRLEAARARGRGVVLVVPHTGNFEVAGVAAARAGFPIHAVAGIQLNERWTPELRRRQKAAGLPILPWSFATWRRLPELLAANEVVALLADGDRFAGGLPVDAFGAVARFPLGPAKLCARTGAALLPAYAVRRPDGTHVARFLPEIPVAALGVRAATARAAAALAGVVREHPEQWMIFRRFHEERSTPVAAAHDAASRCEVAA